jgi:hypothetical protein
MADVIVTVAPARALASSAYLDASGARGGALGLWHVGVDGRGARVAAHNYPRTWRAKVGI